MALVIEDGTIVAGASSFATVEQVRTYATARGLSVSVTDSVVEAQLIKALDYLTYLEPKFAGQRFSPSEQALLFPRSGVTLFGQDLATDAIPQQLLAAQIVLAIESASVDLLPRDSGRIIKKEKLDVIETEYFESSTTAPVPTFPQVEALLAPLFDSGGSISFELVRA